MWAISSDCCGFNNKVPHAIQPVKEFNYGVRHFGTVFSRFGDQNCPSRLCDLIPLDFFHVVF